jgi:hypothetical protein
MDILKAFVGGVVAIGLIGAIGLHAKDLGTLAENAGTAGSGLIKTAQA